MNLLLRPGVQLVPTGGLPRSRNTSPWLSFDDAKQRTRRQRDDDEVLILVAL